MPETKELIIVNEETGAFTKVKVSGEIEVAEEGYEPNFMQAIREEMEALRKERPAPADSLQTGEKKKENRDFDRSFNVGRKKFRFIGKLMAFYHPETNEKVQVKDALKDPNVLKLLVEGNYGLIEKA